MPDPRRSGAYTASDNTLRGRGSGHARLDMYSHGSQTMGVVVGPWIFITDVILLITSIGSCVYPI